MSYKKCLRSTEILDDKLRVALCTKWWYNDNLTLWDLVYSICIDNFSEAVDVSSWR
jgi:hypothetical protein